MALLSLSRLKTVKDFYITLEVFVLCGWLFTFLVVSVEGQRPLILDNNFMLLVIFSFRAVPVYFLWRIVVTTCYSSMYEAVAANADAVRKSPENVV